MDRPEDHLSKWSKYTTHEHEVLIIGAGGAGLRAAIEASGCRAVNVGVVCKSLLGKAHTVMAEGGMAAAMGNVDDRDNWRVHFCRHHARRAVSEQLGAWPSCTPKQAPDRVARAGGVGRAVRPHERRHASFSETSAGTSYPRLAHVGDRTGLEMIRTLQDHGIHQGIDFYMEYTVVPSCSPTAIASPARSATTASAGDSGCLEGARPSCWPPAAFGRAYKVTSNSPGSTPATGTRWRIDAGADLKDMEFVQFHPTGMVWPPSVRGILVTEGVRGEGGILKNNDGRRFMFDDIPDLYKSTRPRTTPRRAGAT